MRQFKPGQLQSGSLYPITSSNAITASYAMSALSASYAISASYEINYEVSSSYAETASFATSASYTITASYALGFNTGSLVTSQSFNAFTASYTTGSFTGSFTGNANVTGSLFGTASWSNFASTASYIETAQTASYVTLAQTASYVNPLNQNVEITGSLKITDSAAVLNIIGNGFGQASLISPNGALVLTPGLYGVQINGAYPDLKVNGNITTDGFVASNAAGSYLTGSLFGTASWSENAQTASYILNAISASYATNADTASNILGGKSPHVPYFITDTTLATSSIYQSGSTSVIINQDNNTSANPEALYVWQPSTSSINVISGKGNLDNYLQLNIQNTNQGTDASSDIVATANNGNELDNYIDMGINSENFDGFLGGPNDSYLYAHSRDMWIGNINDGHEVNFFNSSSQEPIIKLTTLGQAEITGSLFGTSSWAENAVTAITASYALNVPLTASYAISASQAVNANNSLNAVSASHAIIADNAIAANYASIAGNGGVTQIIAGAGTTLIPASGQGNVTIISAGGGGVTIISGSNITSSFVNSNTWVFNHNLGIRTPTITVFDSNYNQIIPENIELIDTASATITFPTLETGFAVGMVGGVAGNAYSASYAIFSTYADTASYFVETDPIFVAKSGSFATTGSNRFNGNQIITGSLIVSSSNTITVIGPMVITGSLLVSGSTIQIGNNTLTGITSLTGSINVSGSQTFIGAQSLTGSLNVSGSTTQIGNNTLTGNTVLSGSINVSGSQTFVGEQYLTGSFLVSGSTTQIGNNSLTGNTSLTGSIVVSGSVTNRIIGNTDISGSINVVGNLNVVSGSAFYRWGNKLFNYGAFSDYTTQSGSAATAHPVNLNTTDVALGIYLSGSSPIKVENTGIYNFQWSGQLNQGAGASVVSIWLRINGTDVPGSRGDITLASQDDALPSWNYVLSFNANDAIELYWSSTSDNTRWVFSPTGSAPPRPSTASLIATLTQIA